MSWLGRGIRLAGLVVLIQGRTAIAQSTPTQKPAATDTTAAAKGAPAPTATYQVEVTNTMPHVMNLLFRDSTEHLLGELKAGEAKTFTLAPSAVTVTLIGREPTMGGDVTQEVTLRAGRSISWSF